MTLSENAKLYGEAFKNGYLCLMGILIDDEITESDELSIEEYTLELENAYISFADELYAEIKDFKDTDEQNAVFYQLKRELPIIVFENEFIGSELKQDLIKKWTEDRPGGYYVIRLLKMLGNSMEWYDANSQRKLQRFIESYDAPVIKEPFKNSFSREAVGYLFFELRSREVINPSMTKKMLAEYISILTGWSAEQIRQTKTTKRGITDSTKDQLRDLFEKILKGLK